MIRKDNALDADRPHFYSQFWVDVASGKRTLGESHTATAERDLEAKDAALDILDELEVEEPEEPIELPTAKPVRPVKPKAEPKRSEPQRPALTSLADLAKIDSLMKSSAEMDDDTVPDIEAAARGAPDVDEAIVTDFDANGAELEAGAVEEEPVAAGDDFGDVEYDEEDEWGEDEDQPRRGSKPNKRRREPRREF